MLKKVVISEEWKEQHCKSCLWLINGALCPFQSCPKVKGWIADKKRSEKVRGGKNGVSN